MGCGASSPSFRETYASLQARWHLRSESYSSPSTRSVEERTQLFQSCATERADSASKKLLLCGTPAIPCSPLLIEQSCLFSPPFMDGGKRNSLHPYCEVVFTRLLGALSAEHACHVQQKEVVSSRVTHFLTRWDYRIWMIACCEVFHVLAVFRETKAMPKKVSSFMSSLLGRLKDAPHAATGAANEPDVKARQVVLQRVWKEGTATLMTAALLTPKVLQTLESQLPSVFKGLASEASRDGTALADRLLSLAKDYEVRLEKLMNLHGGNPLFNASSRERQAAPSFLAFVEWVAVRHALSVCGAEEDPLSYGVRPVEYSEKVLKQQNEIIQLWRQRLHRLEAVEQELAELRPLGEQSETFVALRAEQKALEAETEKLFNEWCGQCPPLSVAQATEKCFEVLGIHMTLPDSAVHEVLSRKAFEVSVVGSATGSIDTPERFRQYLKAYLALHDLYRDVLLHQLSASQRDGTYDVASMPDCVDFESFRAALWASQMRHDIELDPLMAAVGGGWGTLSADDVAEVFHRLFNMQSAGIGDSGGTQLDFCALNATVASALGPDQSGATVRYPVEALASAVGLSDTAAQARFIVTLLAKVFVLSDNRMSSFTTTLVAEALEAVLELPRYTDYSAGVGVLATRFAYLKPLHWAELAVAENSPSEVFAEWLHEVRAESADRLSPEDHMRCGFFVHALFSITAAQRAFEDTLPGAPDGRTPPTVDPPADQRNLKTQRFNSVTKSHFVRAMAVLCTYLDCPAEALLRNCSDLLLADEVRASQAAADNPDLTVESAFRTFRTASQLADGAARPLSAGDEEGSLEDTISVQHILFVVASNYTRLHCVAFWRASNMYGFDDEDAGGVNGQPIARWAAEKQMLALKNAMPLRRVNNTYREFADLAKLAAEDGDRRGNGADAFLRPFLAGFYNHYRSFLEGLALSEEFVTAVGRKAFTYIVSNPSRAGSKEVLTHNDYSAFLQFVLGYLMMQKAYECTVRSSIAQLALAQAEDDEVFLSERDLRRILACFSRLTDGGAENVPAAKDAREWLQSNHIDSGSEGFLLLDNAFLWYGAHRVDSYALESLFSWWKEKMAMRIPYTVSTAHRSERLAATRAIMRIKQHRESAPEDEPVETAEDEDGYLPVDIIAQVMNRVSRLEEVTQRVFYIFEQENTTADAEERRSGGGSSKAAAWLKVCVRGVNAVVHRGDLESREVHHSDFRFLLQYIHHFVSAYVGLYYALTILEASAASDAAAGQHDQIVGVSDKDRGRLLRLFHDTVLPVLMPSGNYPAKTTSVLDALLSRAWEDMCTKCMVDDATCQEVAHGIAAVFVRHSHEISSRARQSYLDSRESQALREEFTTNRAFLGALGSFGASAKLKYWERLRLLLPFGSSLRHRERRRELFVWMDRRQRGYLTISDLTEGLMNLVHLQSFRADFTPVVLRAFIATKEMFGQQSKIVYLTQKSEEQVLLPAELDAFLTYLYRYLELYFMFDVLTCGGHVHPESLHVVQKTQVYAANDDDDGDVAASLNKRKPAASTDSAICADGSVSTAAAATPIATAASRSGAAALLEASKNQYQITLEAASMRKEITLDQFCMGSRLLRRWGAHANVPEKVFLDITNQKTDSGAMSFVEFAIWASEHELHPEGYGYGYDDAIDAIATMEEEYANQ